MYTIKQAAMRSGVDPSLIRAWERRYGVTRPERTPGGYRLYSDEEIAARAATAVAAQPLTTASREIPSPASSPAAPDLVAAAARYDLAAAQLAEALRATRPDLLLAFGGASAAGPLLDGAMLLPARVVDAARAIRGRLR